MAYLDIIGKLDENGNLPVSGTVMSEPIHIQADMSGRAIAVIKDSEGNEIKFDKVFGQFADAFVEFDKRLDRIEEALGVIGERLSVLEYKALKINERLIGVEKVSGMAV